MENKGFATVGRWKFDGESTHCCGIECLGICSSNRVPRDFFQVRESIEMRGHVCGSSRVKNIDDSLLA